VIGVLGASAIAAALLGSGMEETTPHGQVLTALQRVAAAQEDHHARTGSFADWIQSLDVESPADVRVSVTRAGATGWEATATHPIGLTCIQEGRLHQGRLVRDQPVCYTAGP
jgi:hypothetical protein